MVSERGEVGARGGEVRSWCGTPHPCRRYSRISPARVRSGSRDGEQVAGWARGGEVRSPSGTVVRSARRIDECAREGGLPVMESAREHVAAGEDEQTATVTRIRLPAPLCTPNHNHGRRIRYAVSHAWCDRWQRRDSIYRYRCMGGAMVFRRGAAMHGATVFRRGAFMRGAVMRGCGGAYLVHRSVGVRARAVPAAHIPRVHALVA
jgi:hypothetical protein